MPGGDVWGRWEGGLGADEERGDGGKIDKIRLSGFLKVDTRGS